MFLRWLKRTVFWSFLGVSIGGIPLAYVTCEGSPTGFYAYAGDGFFDELEDYLDELFDDDD
jgi:hypothetical protein